MLSLALILSLLLVGITWLPLHKSAKWFIRALDYPRLQKMVLLIMSATPVIFFRFTVNEWWWWLYLIAVLASVSYLCFLVFPYTILGKKMVATVQPKTTNTLTCVVANVYQYNKQYPKAIELITQENPDIILLLETDSGWKNGVQALEDEFPYSIYEPQDNTYGMLFYSKFPIVSHEIKHLIYDDIPSIFAHVALPGGATVLLTCIHPKPPVPNESTKSDDRDAEILLAGEIISKHRGPAMLMGDLNDVAWSHTTRLFLRTSQLTDPRRGRGMFNTFHAKLPFFRWPLDHFFLSTHFGIVQLKTLPNIGSDHFPIMIQAAIAEKPTATTLEKKPGDEKEKQHKIAEGKKMEK